MVVSTGEVQALGNVCGWEAHSATASTVQDIDTPGLTCPPSRLRSRAFAAFILDIIVDVCANGSSIDTCISWGQRTDGVQAKASCLPAIAGGEA